MEVSRCRRCGAFYTDGGYVCAKCLDKDNIELSEFKDFLQKNDELVSLNQISYQTGISEKNLNHFLNYDGFEKYKKLFK